MSAQAAVCTTIKSVCGGGGVRGGGRVGSRDAGGSAVTARSSCGARPSIVRLSGGAQRAAFTARSSRSSSSFDGKRASNKLIVRCHADGSSSDSGFSSGGVKKESSVSAGPTEEPFKFPGNDFLTGGGDDRPIGNQAEAVVKGNSAAVLERSLNPDGGAGDLDYLQELIAIQSGGPKAIGKGRKYTTVYCIFFQLSPTLTIIPFQF